MREALSFISYKNNSHVYENTKKLELSAKCSIGIFNGIKRTPEGRYVHVVKGVPCNTWSCPICRKKKAKALARRALQGAIGMHSAQTGFRSRYEVKMFTFTIPGADYRKRIEGNELTYGYTGENDPEQCYRRMGKSLDKLIRAMKKKYGDFYYFRAVEPQRDGYPHFHVLMVGQSIIPKSIYAYVKNLWEGVYGEGYAWVTGPKGQKGQPRSFRSTKHAVYYMLKYIKKAPGKFHLLSRPITTSRGALLPPVQRKSLWIGFTFNRDLAMLDYESVELELSNKEVEGLLHSQDLLYDPWSVEKQPWEKISHKLDFVEERGLRECLDFFDDIIESRKPSQLRLF